MKKLWLTKKRCLVICLSSMLLVTAAAQAGVVRDSIERAADRLVDVQSADTGTWPSEPEYTGSIVPGLLCAYLVTGKDSYKTSAELAGNYIINSTTNYYGDEAYTLARLSAIADDPDDNAWRDAISGFYEAVSNDPCGTPVYIAWYNSTNPSTAVFYLAHHVVAAYYVDATDRAIWRQALISYLSEVADDTADYPILSLGVATWALAKTGPLDATLVRVVPAGRPYWNGITLADLPALLVSHQVPNGEPYAGTFFWHFDHTDGDPHRNFPVSGYAEDTSFSVLGLVAAAQAGSSPDSGSAVGAAREILPQTVRGDGRVYEHIWLGGYQFNFYAGEMLQALCSVSPAGDLEDDGCVGLIDLATFAAHWLDSGCAYPDWCGGADLNHDTTVNLVDFAILEANWNKCVGE